MENERQCDKGVPSLHQFTYGSCHQSILVMNEELPPHTGQISVNMLIRKRNWQ